MRDETKKMLEKRLNVLNNKMNDKKNIICNWKAVYITGMIGIGAGVLSLHQGRVVAGAIIAIGGGLFKIINDVSLANLKVEKEVLEYGLSHPESIYEYNFDEEDKKGKHLKK